MIEKEYIVYGAGRVGRKIVDLLLKIDRKVVMIWDRNTKKEQTYREIPIINPYKDSQIIQDNKKYRVIIALANELESEKIYQYFNQNGYKQVYQYRGGNGNIIEEFCLEEKKLEENCILCACAETCKKLKKKNLEKLYGISTIEEEKIINNLSVAVTNRCTLNCNYCVQCTSEIKKNGSFYDMTVESLKKYIQSILKEVLYIHELALTGGEVLLCKELPEILKYLCELPQIGYIKILTTATVELSDSLLKILKHPKLVTQIDDYGKEKKIPNALQMNLEHNIKKLSQNGILYQIIDNSNGTWYDLGNIEKREDPIENEKKNKECMFRTCLFLSVRGNLSWCVRNIFCYEYGRIPDDKRDYCDLSKEEEILRIKEILQLQYLHGCEYCSGTNKNNIVIAGEQKD